MLQHIRAKGRLNIWGFLKHIRTQRNFLVQVSEGFKLLPDIVKAVQKKTTHASAMKRSR